jgi:hypothetical protein
MRGSCLLLLELDVRRFEDRLLLRRRSSSLSLDELELLLLLLLRLLRFLVTAWCT